MVDFSDINSTEELIKGFLQKANYAFAVENPDEENFKLYFSVEFEDHDIGLFIGLTNENPFRIDIVSAVNFSPEHIKIIKENPENIKHIMLNNIFMWMTPREPQFIIKFNEDNDFENSYYLIITPLYEGELSFGNFMRSIDKTIKGSLLTRRIIQNSLDKFMKKEEEEE